MHAAWEWRVGRAAVHKVGNGGFPAPGPLPPHSTPSSPCGARLGGPVGGQFRVEAKKGWEPLF